MVKVNNELDPTIVAGPPAEVLPTGNGLHVLARTDGHVATDSTIEVAPLSADTETRPFNQRVQTAYFAVQSDKRTPTGRAGLTERSDSEDTLKLYLEEIGDVPLLTKDEEVELAQLIEVGKAACDELKSGARLSRTTRNRLRYEAEKGEAAEQRFISSNLRLVVSVARKYQSTGLPLLDLIQEGNLGLIKAVEKFDWRKGFKFSTYATWWIRQAIGRGIASSINNVRLTLDTYNDIGALIKFETQFAQQNGFTPDDDTIITGTGISADRLAFLRNVPQQPISLDEPVDELKADATLSDVIDDDFASPVDAISDRPAVLNDQLQDSIDKLTDEEAGVIRLCVVQGLSHAAAARQLGFEGRDKLTLVKRRALDKLRHPLHGYFEELDRGNEWKDKAKCQGLPLEWFFPTKGHPNSKPKKEICPGCQVSKKCLEYAIETKAQNGVWGGKDPTDRELLKTGGSVQEVSVQSKPKRKAVA